MSIPVEIDALADVLSGFGPGYLDDGLAVTPTSAVLHGPAGS